MAMKKNTIPDRWLEYSNIGEPISGTRFVAFKVPLGENFFLKLRPNDRFGPGHLFEALPHLGLVIDLTNTDRYYQPELFARSGIRHQKIACPGRAIPADRIVRKFCNVAHEFLRHTATDGSLIGVHCTHGINRSGYMICSYMIREMLMNPRDAIAAFEVARGHNIERKEYIDALLNLRPDGSISDRQRIMDTEYLGETGPSSSTGTIGIGQGYRHSTQWNSHSELPDGVVRMRPNSLFTVGPSTSTRSPWFSISGPEVNIRPTTSGSPDSTWSSMTGTVAGSFERNFSSNIHGYSTIPRLHTAGMYTRTHLPYTTSRPGTDLNIEPEHSSTAEYGSSQRERPMADGFSDPNTTQQIRYGGDLERREAPKRRSAAPCMGVMEDAPPSLGAVTSEPSQTAITFVSPGANMLPSRSPSPVIAPCSSPDFRFGSYNSPSHALEIGSLCRMPQCSGSCFGSYSMYQEGNNGSPQTGSSFFPDTSLPKTRKFDHFAFNAVPRFFIAPNLTGNSSDNITSSSALGLWPRTLRGVSNLSNDIDLNQQYDIGCIPRPQFNTGVDFGPRFNPFSGSGYSAVSSDVEVDCAEERKPRDGGIIVPVDSQHSPVTYSSPSPSSFIMAHGLQASPQVPSRVPAPLQVLEDLPAHIGPRNESYVDQDLTPRLDDRALDWESVLSSLHRRTTGNAGRASRHAMSNSAPFNGENREYRNEQPLRLRVDVRTTEANPNVQWGTVLTSFQHQPRESSSRVSQYSIPSAATSTLETRDDNYVQPTESENNSEVSHTTFPSGVSSLSKSMYNHRYPTEITDETVKAEAPYDCAYSATLPLGSGLSSVLGVMDLRGVEKKPQNEGGIFRDLSDGQHSQVTSSSPVSSSSSPFTPPPPLDPLPAPIEPFPLVTPAMPSTLPVAPEVLEDLTMPSEPPNEFSDVDRESESRFRDRDLDWEAILASLHRHTRMSAGRASRHAMRSSPTPVLEGREENRIQIQQRSPSSRYSEDPQTGEDESERRGNERRRRRRTRRRHRRGANNGRGFGIDINRIHEEANGDIAVGNVIAGGPVGPEGAMSSLEVLGGSGRSPVSSSMVE